MSKQCARKIVTPAGERYCKLPAQEGSLSTATNTLHPPQEGPHRPCPEKPEPPDDSSAPLSLGQPALSVSTAPATGCVKDINTLVADADLWETIIDTLSPRFKHLHDTEEMAYKDLYVTEALRCAVTPSEACPQALVAFKGGTSLVKAHRIINRFSEDIDVNIIPPTEGTFGSARRKRARREFQTRLNAGIPLPMEHKRFGDRFASTTITYPPLTENTTAITAGPTFGDVLVEMNIRDQPADTTNLATVTSLVGEAAAEIAPALLEEYPMLEPFEVLTADPDHRGCRQTRRAPLAQPPQRP